MRPHIDPHDNTSLRCYPRGMARTKSLDADTNSRLRTLVRDIVDSQFEGKVSVAAQAEPRISHSLLFEFLSGQRGGGVRLLEWISARTGRNIDDLMGRGKAAGVGPTLSDHKDWARAVDEAKRLYGKRLDSSLVRIAGTAIYAGLPERLSPEFVKLVHDTVGQIETDRVRTAQPALHEIRKPKK